MRRVVVVDRQMPDVRVAERRRAYVDRIGTADELAAPAAGTEDVGASDRRRGGSPPSAIEVATGTYAIVAHRDHAHLLYELEPRIAVGPSDDALGALLVELRIAQRGSLLTTVATRGRARPFDPALLDQVGVEIVFGGVGARSPVAAGRA